MPTMQSEAKQTTQNPKTRREQRKLQKEEKKLEKQNNGDNHDKKSQKKKQREEKRKNKPKIRRVFPIWLRIVVVIVLSFAALLAGLMVGYGILGGGNPTDALNFDTWEKIIKLVNGDV
ncbi:DNA-directed RNA polymerase subunit beta [Aquibacillus rhizosphaerae]|uniref:DNA-directed RNA polymerase subunit beta n=1 Tax=Aquibacillus rhizosphaerae TaxID=3051431 RepID=A0ABT7KZH9_9BACI|nr:DNA-directed RNA polymerase subunit beta [Aquibacillus sp. LR5S19]MDL4838875.1 DNA-directed RNA polymerase subunit beta [Aquibacillus sp. LR5S19]